MVAITQVNSERVERLRAVTLALLDYCRSQNWAGYDPYDALNSRLLQALPFLDSRLPRIALTQLLKRSPVNVRPLLRIPHTQNPKALGLFLEAFIKLDKAGVLEDGPEMIREMADKLIDARSDNPPYFSWGYSFPWQTRTIVVPRGTPNLVCTTFGAHALLEAFDYTGDSRYLEAAARAAQYISEKLYWEEGGICSFSYPLPGLRSRIHNANFLAAGLLARIHSHIPDDRMLEQALRATRYSASRQNEDGSWPYGELPKQGWVDNFHTGYNLSGLREFTQYTKSSEFRRSIHVGLNFYKRHFFTSEGAPRYFHNNTYPIDVHCLSQGILTPVEFASVWDGAMDVAYGVLNWSVRNMRSEDGYFYYRILPFAKIKTPYMRWGQAWMLLALSSLLEASCNNPTDHVELLSL
jgi:hypothetical protein